MTNSDSALDDLAQSAVNDGASYSAYHHRQSEEAAGRPGEGTEDENEEEDEDESECHFLIGEGRSSTRASQSAATRELTRTAGKTTHGSQLTSDQPYYSPASSHSCQALRRGLLGRMLDGLTLPSASSGAGKMSSSRLQSTSDFVFYPDWPDGAPKGERFQKRKDATGKAPAPQPCIFDSLHPKKRSQQTTNQCLLLIIFLALIFASTMFLIKLLSLVPSKPTSSMSLNSLEVTPKTPRLESLGEDHAKRWLVATPKCHIPQLDPWHESIRGYVRHKEPLDCSAVIEETYRKQLEELNEKRNDSDTKMSLAAFRSQQMQTHTLSFVRANKLYFTESAVVEMGVFSENNCCYRSIERSQDNDDDLEYQEQCQPIQEQGLAVVNCTLIKVECPALNYTNIHTFIMHDNEEEEALKRVAENKLDDEAYYNILMLGVDTISRLNGMRQLNGTLKLLLEQYGTLEFKGYNKVGENTFPNLIPLLTGLKPEQLTQIQCWMATNYTQDNDRGDDYLDNCKYLWNFYQQLGYVTYFSEDWPSASTFNYLKPGFKREPTNYYGRPFTLARDPLLFPKFESIGCASCQLDTPVVQIDLDNLRRFLEGHSGQPYFAFHWINCPQHDDLNGASSVDDVLEQFFADIRNSTKLDRTFVIFFSDHGYRWNNFVSTRIGHYESSLPLLTIAPPDRFIARHPELYERLKLHQSALLTPFDLFKTLVAIRDLGAVKSVANQTTRRPQHESDSKTTITTTSTTHYPTATTSIQQIQVQDGTSFKHNFKSLSLLDHHTPDELDRSCIDAGIPDNYCVCHQFDPVEVGSLDVLGAAYYLVYVHLETRIRNHQQICHLLDLEQVHRAELFDFEQMQSSTSKNKTATKRKSRRQSYRSSTMQSIQTTTKTAPTTFQPNYKTVTTPRPADSRVIPADKENGDETIEKKHQYLPKREYNVMFSTKPGGGLFQEIVRFYGDDMDKCKLQVEKARKIIEDDWASHKDRHATVLQMNRVCEFSVLSESIARLNLYKDQSKCVRSNIELKKICYCK